MPKRTGQFVLELPSLPAIAGAAACVGKKEGEGPLSAYFDTVYDDTTLGQIGWEAAESQLLNGAITAALSKANIAMSEVDYLLAGDLLNQCIGTTFGVKELNIPLLGLFGACSTMGLSLGLAAVLVDAGAANTAVAATSSHFCSAERQFRFPLEYGGQRTPTSQWTATGAGSAVVRADGEGPFIKSVTFGKIVDYDITDINNMGAAMAPAAADTLKRYFKGTGNHPVDFDLILTGDLGVIGTKLLCELLLEDGYDIKDNHNDCGLMLYDIQKQNVGAGGSGCGCGASVLCSYIIKAMQEGKFSKILFCSTGALMSPISAGQGLSIPSIAHCVELINVRTI